jgi:hypothetical protein
MTRLNPDKLHVTYLTDVYPDSPITPRSYTLTHSDKTGELYLTIGRDFNLQQTSGWYTRFMRDEVLAEWKVGEAGFILQVYCHVSGGLILGTAKWRLSIFRRELPLVLEAIRYGDQRLFDAHPNLDQARILVHFQSPNPKYNKTEGWGSPIQYKI